MRRTFPRGNGLRLSHRMVLFLAALGSVSGYLIAVAVGGYYIGSLGGESGEAARLVFVASALLILVALLTSKTARSNFRVFVQKHFQRYKYDYRNEWLRFTQALSEAAGEAGILEISVRAIADIVDSPGGLMYTLDDTQERFVPMAATPHELGDELPLDAGDPLPAFLTKTGWIVSLRELRNDPGCYEQLSLPGWLADRREAWLVIPLFLGPSLTGFVVLDRPPVVPELNFEDHDLLKTVGRDVATHISEFDASRRLAESRQFIAYHQLSAFVIHDLKNLIAQLSLVVRNAEKHRRNPEFVDDSIATIANSVDRMTRLIGQLSSDAVATVKERIVLDELLAGVIERCRDRSPEPRLVLGDGRMTMLADPERLSSALEHLVRNAQEATTPGGSVAVTLSSRRVWASIEVRDDGVGMDDSFVRRGLFSPFSTTKGQAGMGIGAYQAREYVRSLGGDIHVRSARNRGTTLEIRLPVTEGDAPSDVAGGAD